MECGRHHLEWCGRHRSIVRRARIAQTLAVTETFNLGSFGEVVLATGRLDNPTNVVDPGPDAIALQALNDRSRIIVDDGSNQSRQNLDPGPYPENGGLAAGDPNRTGRIGDHSSPHAARRW